MLNLFQHLFSCRFRIRQLTDGMTRKDVKLNLMLFFIILNSLGEVFAQTKNSTTPDFKWGNAAYFNLNVGESIFFNNAQIKLLKLENHFNQIQVNRDTIWIKVSKRSLPASINGLRIFVADNKNVKECIITLDARSKKYSFHSHIPILMLMGEETKNEQIQNYDENRKIGHNFIYLGF